MKKSIIYILFALFSFSAAVSLTACKDDGVEISDAYKSKTPKNVKLLEYGNKSLTICWDFVRGATSYTVQLVDGDMNPVSEALCMTTADIDYHEFTDLPTDRIYYGRVRANYPYSATSDWVYVTEHDKPAMLMASVGILDLDPQLKLHAASGSTLTFEWSYTDDKATDAARSYNVELFRDEACTDLYVSWLADGKLSWSYAMPADCRAKMLDLLAPYTVHFVTGHTHINYANRITERMTEHNIAAVCATWWWTGNYTNGRTQMCRDGAPAGYGLFEIGTAGADDVQWHYQGIGKAADYQFRAYDLNRCLITRDKYCPDIKNNFGTVSAEFFAQYANGYDRPRSDNTVLINVFNWNEKWKVEVREVETGNRLPVEQVDTYDPLHTIHFNMNRMNTNSTAMTFPTLLTSHMFEAVCSSPTTTLEITVTDEFGRSYTETMSRPRELYDMSVSPQW